jgi:hypothetical protein
MKSERGFLRPGFPAFPRQLPSPHFRNVVLNYFKYNNFQDFNTWQQIAKTKLEYQYQEHSKGVHCALTLKWDDKATPPLIAKGDATVRKVAKRRALSSLVDTLIAQGMIARGFKEDNFFDRLPRRRKNESD